MNTRWPRTLRSRRDVAIATYVAAWIDRATRPSELPLELRLALAPKKPVPRRAS